MEAFKKLEQEEKKDLMLKHDQMCVLISHKRGRNATEYREIRFLTYNNESRKTECHRTFHMLHYHGTCLTVAISWTGSYYVVFYILCY